MGRSSIPFHSPASWCGRCIAALLVLMQLTDLAACGQTYFRRSEVDLTQIKHNIINGLNLEKLPDMAQVDISNDEFHCKYLEYFRRLYANDDGDDETAAVINGTSRGDDNGVSSIGVRGRTIIHDVDVGSPVPVPEDINSEEGVELRATITFLIGRAIANDYGPTSVIKSVVRIYGKQLVGSSSQVGSGDGSGDGSSSRDISGYDVSSSEFGDAVQVSAIPVRVYGRRVSSNGTSREKPSLVTVLTFPAVGRGRWRDVDVTRLLKARKPHVANVAEEPTTLELSFWYPTASETIQINGGCDGCHADRLPVMHCFLDGNLEYTMWPLGDVEPMRCTGHGTIRKKRDGVAAVRGGGRGRKNRRRRPSASESVRRTDCKVDQSSMVGTNNGTNKCCREQMRVVFADIPGFDFIIEPKWFDAGLCRGRCPAKYNPATRHAFIQSLLNNNRGVADLPRNRRQRRRVRHGGEKESREATGVVSPWTPSIPRPSPPKPCCAPSTLDKLEIIHVDEADPNKLTVTTWKEMVVVECACS